MTKYKTNKIKGPDNPTSQLLPIMSFKGCSGVREGRKDKGGGEKLCVKVCEKIVCMYVCMYVYIYIYVCTYVRVYVCMYIRTYVRTYVRMYVCMNVCMCMCVTKLRVKDGVCESDVCFLLAIFRGRKQDISIAVCISLLHGLRSQAEGRQVCVYVECSRPTEEST